MAVERRPRGGDLGEDPLDPDGSDAFAVEPPRSPKARSSRRAAAPAASLTNLAGYALLGAIFFLVSALRLGRNAGGSD